MLCSTEFLQVFLSIDTYRMDARPIHRGIDSRPRRCLRPCRWTSCKVGTDALDTYANSNLPRWHSCCMRAQVKPPSSWSEVETLRLQPSTRIQTRTTASSRIVESSQSIHASHPRSDHHWLHLYRGVRYYYL